MYKIPTLLLSITIFLLAIILCRSIAPQVILSSIEAKDPVLFSAYLTMQANQFALLQVYLSALGILLTVLGFVLAMAAIWGYKDLTSTLQESARKMISETVPGLIKKEMSNASLEQLAKLAMEQKMSKTSSSQGAALNDIISLVEKDPSELPSEVYVGDNHNG